MNEEKYRRMEIRKETGSRIVVPPSTPDLHKGPEYAMSFACFGCQKSFKRHYDLPPCDYPDQMTCPECGESSVNLGRNFKAPKKSDCSQWAKVKFLVDHGFVFQKIRINESETVPYPESLSEAKEFVVKYKKYAISQKTT